ncbi:hypothetical protein [Pseudomonas frederiksbergensis]|uniref:hypothetical protein n=1 Tax=Pseudomonas frederiksbergensis TaxID=104087 RepID=UPI00101ADC96|nr:hypothetical protein [Pseudomonas frederiksbergensis]
MTSLTTLSPIAIVLLLICVVVVVQFAREHVAAFIYCITPVKKESVAPSPAEPRPTGATKTDLTPAAYKELWMPRDWKQYEEPSFLRMSRVD